MSRRKTNPDFLTGIPELLVLRILSRNPMHGYAVVQAIKTLSGGNLSFGEGSIYPVLHRLESDGILRTKTKNVDGRSRIIYTVTAAGKRRLVDSKSTWEKVVASVEQVFNGGEDGSQSMA